VFQKNRRQFSNKDFPLGQVSGYADNLDFEKLKGQGRLRINTADSSHFLEDCSSTCPSHLAHAIATQTQRETKAMARAKPTHTNQTG
jgi:hypothetical protein